MSVGKNCVHGTTIYSRKTHRVLKELILITEICLKSLEKTVYLDESYVHQSYKLQKCWQSIDVSGVNHNVSKGKRYIIVHAGSEKGFIPNALLIFTGANKNADI